MLLGESNLKSGAATSSLAAREDGVSQGPAPGTYSCEICAEDNSDGQTREAKRRPKRQLRPWNRGTSLRPVTIGGGWCGQEQPNSIVELGLGRLLLFFLLRLGANSEGHQLELAALALEVCAAYFFANSCVIQGSRFAGFDDFRG